MSNEAEEELVYVKMGTGDILLLIAQLSTSVTHLVTATTALAQGSPSIAEEAAALAGKNVDQVVSTLRTRVEEAMAAHERR